MANSASFIYFDLGNVIVNFDPHRATRQMGEVAGVPKDLVWQVVFETNLHIDYERGDISTREFYEAFCEQTNSDPKEDELLHAASDMFELNTEIVPVLQRLHEAGHRLGILSNTNDAHWNFIFGERFPIVTEVFEVFALSFEMRLVKPEREIYKEAAKLAEVATSDVFFTDDRPENVEGAIAAGFDAVQFVGVDELKQELSKRRL